MRAAVNALTAVHGTRYKYGPAAITICKYSSSLGVPPGGGGYSEKN